MNTKIVQLVKNGYGYVDDQRPDKKNARINRAHCEEIYYLIRLNNRG